MSGGALGSCYPAGFLLSPCSLQAAWVGEELAPSMGHRLLAEGAVSALSLWKGCAARGCFEGKTAPLG